MSALVKSIDNNFGRAYNQLTSIKNDSCTYQNDLLISSKPMKYYVNTINSPEANPFFQYTEIGNQKSYDVRNEFERPLPTRLNPIYPSYVSPYKTTPFLGSNSEDRVYTNTGSNLRFGNTLRDKKSSIALDEIDYNRWSPGVDGQTTQNAGQYGSNSKTQQPIGTDGHYNFLSQNNVIFGNSAIAGHQIGISSRNLLQNYSEKNNC